MPETEENIKYLLYLYEMARSECVEQIVKEGVKRGPVVLDINT